MNNYLEKAERVVLKVIRKVRYGQQLPEKPILPMGGEELNALIRKALFAPEPFMVARYGSIELSAALYPYLLSLPLKERYRLYVKGRIDFLHADGKIEISLIAPLCNNAGFFPEDTSLIRHFSSLMLDDTSQLDVCCCSPWIHEDLLFPFFDKEILFGNLDDMEPYDYAKPWSKALEGKKVLVIHPFAKSIESQYARRELLWDNPDVLPAFELKTIKAVQTIAGEKTQFKDWFEALEYMKAQMDATDYDVAIIGCGAYGFHLAAHAKRTGHKTIHLGGATQILFGIKGKRWEELPAVSKFFNEYWVSPLPEETPQHNARVEGGCYW